MNITIKFNHKYIELLFKKNNITLTKIIYKYRNWENKNQRRFITNNEIYFASPKSLNDPLELLNIFHFELLSYDKKVNFVSKIIKTHESWRSDKDIYEKAKAWIDNDSKDNFRQLKRLGLRQTKNVRNNIGVFSTTNTGDNHHMWMNYANMYHGFCIGYALEELKTNMSDRSIGGFGNNVTYYESLPVIIPDIEENINNLFDLCFTKINKWRPEDEFRLLKFRFKNKKISIKSSIIKEIIIGQEMITTSKSMLLKQVVRKYHNCKFYIALKPEKGTNKKAKLIELTETTTANNTYTAYRN